MLLYHFTDCHPGTELAVLETMVLDTEIQLQTSAAKQSVGEGCGIGTWWFTTLLSV